MARHSERSLPSLACANAGQPTVSTPRPTCSRVTTTDGRSPGLRIAILRRLPRTRVPSGFVTKNSPLTVAGAAAGSSSDHSHRIPILIPRGEPSPSRYWRRVARVNCRRGAASIQDLPSVVGVTQAAGAGRRHRRARNPAPRKLQGSECLRCRQGSCSLKNRASGVDLSGNQGHGFEFTSHILFPRGWSSIANGPLAAMVFLHMPLGVPLAHRGTPSSWGEHGTRRSIPRLGCNR